MLRPNNNSSGAVYYKINNKLTGVSAGELLIDTQSATSSAPFHKTNLTTLINMIYGAEGDMETQIAELTSQLTDTPESSTLKAITAYDLRAKTYNKTSSNYIKVSIGGLEWMVTFVSTDVSGNLIATLWYDATDVSSTYSADGYYTTTPDVPYPSNMYGTSYVRVVTLNNPKNRFYATNSENSIGTELSAEIAQEKTISGNKFALYTVSDFGLTNYLTTPNQMKWMINRQSPTCAYPNYWLNNESLSSSNVYNYGVNSDGTNSNTWYSDSDGVEYCYEEKDGYDNWGEDYLWLPSVGEIGPVINGKVRYGGNGMWKLGRELGEGSGENTWYRSACYYDAYSACHKETLKIDAWDVYGSYKVRPAMLLNLTAVANSFVDFNVTVSTPPDSTGEYLDVNGTSYNSAYEADKSQITVQFCDTETGALVASHTFDKLWGDATSTAYTTGVTFNYGDSLTKYNTYKVHIIAPTYLRYSVKYYIEQPSDTNETGKYNEFSNINTFMIYFGDTQSLSVEVLGIEDNSWITSYG